MNILFLDDDLNRCKKFKSNFPIAVITHTAVDCINELKNNPDIVFLDHDLEGVFCNSEDKNTGMEVVRFLCKNKVDVKIVVHSMNYLAYPIMIEKLKNYGYELSSYI